MKVEVKRTKVGGGVAALVAGLKTLSLGPTGVKVGFPAGETDGGIIERAIWNEFGTKGGGWGGPIPERPFMRNAIRSNTPAYRNFMASAAKKLVRDLAAGTAAPTSMRRSLNRLGAMAQGDIQAEITSLTTPPNSAVTVERKGSSKPLIDTGQLRASVTWKVDR